MRYTDLGIALTTLAVIVGGCAAPSAPGSSPAVTDPTSGDPAGSPFPAAVRSGEPYAPAVDPSDFVRSVDHPYFPLAPGTRWVLHGRGDTAGEVDEIEVLAETREVMGVVCTVVRDVVSLDGEPVEVTDDWYAQDADGNVWYFGEATTEYRNGQPVSTAGSWEAGVDGAMPGIIMPADPSIGIAYRQEFYAGEAEDMAVVVAFDASADVPAGAYGQVLVTEDWTPLEPDVRERKFYAPGVGLVMERQIAGGRARFELVEYRPAG